MSKKTQLNVTDFIEQRNKGKIPTANYKNYKNWIKQSKKNQKKNRGKGKTTEKASKVKYRRI